MKFLKICCALVLGAALAGQPMLAGEQKSDDEIYDQVRRKLASNPEVKGGAIEVDVQSGVVTLRGKVKEAKQKSKAEKVARKVKGVKKVVNELRDEL